MKPSGPLVSPRPEVRVAGRLGAPDQILVVRERRHGERQRQSPAGHLRVSLYGWDRVTAGWTSRGSTQPRARRRDRVAAADRRDPFPALVLARAESAARRERTPTPGSAASATSSCTGFETFPILRWLLLLAAAGAADPRLHPRPRPQALLAAGRDDDGRRLRRVRPDRLQRDHRQAGPAARPRSASASTSATGSRCSPRSRSRPSASRARSRAAGARQRKAPGTV